VLRIQRALLGELLLIFVLSGIMVTAVVFLGVMLRAVQGGGGALGSGALLALLPHMLPIAATYSVPFAWLTATAFVFGRWSSDHELVALSAAGIHSRTLIGPYVMCSVILGVAGMLHNGWSVPIENRALHATLSDFVPQFLSSLRGSERSVTFDLGRLSFDRWDERDRALVSVELDRRDRNGRLGEKIIAARLRLQQVSEANHEPGLRLEFEDAYVMRAPQGEPEMSWQGAKGVTVGHVQRVGASMLFNDFLGAARFRSRPKDLTIGELLYALENDGIVRGSVPDLEIAFHGRLAAGVAALFLGLFAMAMAMALPASSHRVRDFTLCTAPAVLIFYPLQIAGPTLARSLHMSPWLMMWMPHLVLLGASILLLAKAVRR